MKKIITIFAIFFGLQTSGNVIADDHAEGNWIVGIGKGVAHMAHICTLKKRCDHGRRCQDRQKAP